MGKDLERIALATTQDISKHKNTLLLYNRIINELVMDALEGSKKLAYYGCDIRDIDFQFLKDLFDSEGIHCYISNKDGHMDIAVSVTQESIDEVLGNQKVMKLEK